MNGEALMAFVKYLSEIVLSGDYSNEYLIQLPKASWDDIWAAGKWVSAWLGF